MSTHHHSPKLVIFGRDGILNVFRDDHVKAPQEWIPIEGALEAVARLNQAGWHAVVATNQSGIGRGLVDMTSLNAIHRHMMESLAKRGGRIDAVFICPHVPEDHCSCRKPLPGLMLQIAQRYGIDDLARVPMVCDTSRDLQAAAAAGCEPHVVRTGRAAGIGAEQLTAWTTGLGREAHVHDTLADFAHFVLHREHVAAGVVGEDSRPGSMND
jgi:D-glycero-D-manno-heptose 1,7-bisphosphate phosphatase